MSKYLFIGNYSVEGAKAILAAGGTARRSAVSAAVEGLGGSLEGFYFAFGPDDVYVLADLPDATSAAALALLVGASGVAGVRTVVLLTPEDVDNVAKVKALYNPPGS
ncbi:MAG TPA: GYD domain-containing protein [Ilumatobacteraceae bacterium]